jgi:hypothetical protein|tara:strand:- start:12827 stop:13096 length:270 start_codon:yes stop_codon:yes gene_type:complete
MKNPTHYIKGKYEHWDVVIDWGLDYFCGCATKYIARHRHKGTPVKDIEKAIHYLEKYLQYLKAEEIRNLSEENESVMIKTRGVPPNLPF